MQMVSEYVIVIVIEAAITFSIAYAIATARVNGPNSEASLC